MCKHEIEPRVRYAIKKRVSGWTRQQLNNHVNNMVMKALDPDTPEETRGSCKDEASVCAEILLARGHTTTMMKKESKDA